MVEQFSDACALVEVDACVFIDAKNTFEWKHISGRSNRSTS